MIGKLLRLDNIRGARQALKKCGYFTIEDAYPSSFCREVVEIVDSHVPDQRTEVNYAGTELRIWDAQKRHELLYHFYDQCNVFTAALTGMDVEADTLLAIRNRTLESSDQKSRLDRWHIDSFRRQIKIFLFLTETTEQSGPFEFIPGTQAVGFKTWMLARGLYIRPADLLFRKPTRAYQRIADSVVEELAKSGIAPIPFICKAGTALVVDSSSIHRARPCTAGTRYALTAYCRAH
jgi:ectoine hydroxylase-related dioxygenase (phytanoyl-CoA dioxygenase family)